MGSSKSKQVIHIEREKNISELNQLISGLAQLSRQDLEKDETLQKLWMWGQQITNLSNSLLTMGKLEESYREIKSVNIIHSNLGDNINQKLVFDELGKNLRVVFKENTSESDVAIYLFLATTTRVEVMIKKEQMEQLMSFPRKKILLALRIGNPNEELCSTYEGIPLAEICWDFASNTLLQTSSKNRLEKLKQLIES